MSTIDNKILRRGIAVTKRNYIGRIISYILFILMISPELARIGMSTIWWIYIIGYLIIFPHIAYYIAKNSRDPKKTEARNILIEGFFQGTLYTGIAFNFIPMLTIFSVGVIYICFFGGIRLFLKTCLSIIVGILFAGLFLGFNFEPESGPTSTLIAGFVITFSLLGLAVNIKAEYDKNRGKVYKNNEKLEGLANKLSKYLSPQVYNQIFLGKKDVRLESYRKTLTVFFSDIVGFTTLTDSMESESISALLNSYFDEMSRIAIKHGGTIDKFMGDSIMIFFGDPESKGEREDALACVRMSLEMNQRLSALRKRWDSEGISKSIGIRMGMHTGESTVGNFGSENRLDYTVIGSQVNLAKKIESLASSEEILISEATYNLVKDDVVCQPFNAHDKSEIPSNIKVYRVLGFSGQTDTENKSLSIETQGFSLSMDSDKIDRNQLLQVLKSTMDTIESSRARRTSPPEA
ncbi:MAG: hypothetical protein KJP00_08545 [Bacteroidia bacterium]|nr:hypothetical protein [Bacteroidia bacterium]